MGNLKLTTIYTLEVVINNTNDNCSNGSSEFDSHTTTNNIKPKIMTNKQVSKEIIISSIFLIIMFSLFTITLSL